MSWQVGVFFSLDRRLAVGVHHFHGADSIQIVQPDALACCDLNDTLLAVLAVNALLRVCLKPVVEAGPKDMDVTGGNDSQAPCCLAVGVGRVGAGFEGWISTE